MMHAANLYKFCQKFGFFTGVSPNLALSSLKAVTSNGGEPHTAHSSQGRQSPSEATKNKLSLLLKSKGVDISDDHRRLSSDLSLLAPSLAPQELTFLMQNFVLLSLPEESEEAIALSGVLLRRLDQVTSAVSSREFYLSLKGIADIGIQVTFKSGGASETPNLVNAIPGIMQDLSKEHLGSLIITLSKLGFSWGDAADEIRQTIMDCIETHCSSMTVPQLSLVLRALSFCKVSWAFLSPSLKDKVLKTISSQIKACDLKDIPLLLQPLSKLGVRADMMSQELSDSLLRAFMNSLISLSPQGISQAISSAARMGLRPLADNSSIPFDANEFHKAVEQALPKMSSHELCSLVQALKEIGCKVDGKGRSALPSPLVNALYLGIEKEAGRLSALNLQVVLTSFSTMGFKWKQMPAFLQTSLLSAMQREGRNLHPGAFVDMLSTLRVLKPHLGSSNLLSDREVLVALLAALEKNLPNLSYHRVCTALVAIAELGGIFGNLPVTLKRALDTYLQHDLLDEERGLSADTAHGSSGDTSSSIDKSLVGSSKNGEDDIEEKLRRLLSTLVELKAHYSEFSSNLRSIIIECMKRGQKRNRERMERLSSKSSSPHYSSNFFSLGITWGALDKDAKIALQHSLSESLRYASSLQARRYIGALVLMEAGPWGYLVPELKAAILNRVDEMFRQSSSASTTGGEEKMSSSEVSLILSYLCRLHMHWSDLSPNMKFSLQSLLTQQPPQGGKSLPSILNSLGRMGMRWDSLSPLLKEKLTNGIERLGDYLTQNYVKQTSNDEEFNPSSLANLLFGLAAMDVRSSVLSAQARSLIKTLAAATLPKATTTQYANTLNSMGKMEISVGKKTKVVNERLGGDTFAIDSSEDYNDEDKNTNLPLKKLLIKETEWRLEGGQREKPMNEQHLSNTIFAMGSMGISWHDLSPEVKNKIGDSICRLLPPSDKVTLEDSAPLPTTKYYGRISRDVKLGQVSGKEGISDNNRKSLSVNKNWGREYFCSQGLSMLVVGLSRMGASWVELPLAVRNGLLEAFAQLLPEMRPPHIALTCLGFYELQLFWTQIEEQGVAMPLLNALQKFAKSSSPAQQSLPDISFALVSLGKVGLTSEWIQEHNPTLLDDITRGMVQLMRVGSGGETAGGLEALASLDISYSSLPKEVQFGIQEAIKRICPLAPAPLTSCPTAVLCSLMYSTSLLLFDSAPAEFDEGIRSMIGRLLVRTKELLSRGVEFTKAERDRMGQFFTCLRVFYPENYYPALPRLPPLSPDRKDGGRSRRLQEGENEDSINNNGSASFSKEQDDIDGEDLELLRWGQGVSLRQEFIGLQDEVFPVDIAIFRIGKLVALIEIDGPIHYDSQGKLRRGDLMKELLYKETYKGVLFVRVRYEQVDKFGFQIIGKQLAKYLYLQLRDR
eukprot:gene28757-34718_t